MVKSKATFLFFLAIFFLCIPLTLIAHPHTFMDMRITVLTNETEVTGFEVQWQFDFVFSAETYYESDYNQDGVFDKAELKDLEYYAFNNLENYHYFTTIFHNGKKFLPKKYKNFRANYNRETELLTYYFIIPYTAPLTELKNLSIGIYDDTFYCDVAFFPTQPFAIRGAGATQVVGKVKEAKSIVITYDNEIIGSQREDSIYSGSYTPYVLNIYLKKG